MREDGSSADRARGASSGPGLGVALRNMGNKKEFPTFTANNILRLINRAVWREDGNITSVPGASITLEVMYTS